MRFERNGFFNYRVEVEDSPFSVEVRVVPEEPGVEYLEIELRGKKPERLPLTRVTWTVPHCDVQGIWRPSGADRPLPGVWNKLERVEATASAPVACLFAFSGANRCTVAFSDAVDVFEQRWALREEDACWVYDARLFACAEEPAAGAAVRFRIDVREVSYEDALERVGLWWRAQYGGREIPDFCRMPTYSTWYSYHQMPSAAVLERQARLAAEIGCRSMILDDGWQMEDASRSYLYCGDWDVCEAEFPDMAGHVRAVSECGLKYMVWFAVPFVGRNSEAWMRFRGMFLPGEGDTRCLDPRYPAVRSYLLDKYLSAAREWGIDGLKLDFIDMFRQPEREDPDALPGRDFASVSRAVVSLLEKLTGELRAIRPEFALEFRQSYIGPVMNRFATMYRVADCPGDFRQNKAGSVNVRLLSGDVPVHSDMLLWHGDERAREVALQLQHVLFCVPQISVRLEEMGAETLATLKYWLAFWTEHRELLLKGRIRAAHPEMGYTRVSVERGNSRLTAIYADECVDLFERVRRQIVVNAKHGGGVVCRMEEPRRCRVTIRDHRGEAVSETEGMLRGVFELPVPGSGLAWIEIL